MRKDETVLVPHRIGGLHGAHPMHPFHVGKPSQHAPEANIGKSVALGQELVGFKSGEHDQLKRQHKKLF